MPFIELTSYLSGRRLIINTDKVASIYIGKRYDKAKVNYVDITVIQEAASADSFWEVLESIDEIMEKIRTQEKQ